MDHFDRWLELKLKDGFSSLTEPAETVAEFKRVTGARCLYGKVRVSATPAVEFSFTSVAVWPREAYDEYVMLGILDVLMASTLRSVLGVAFVLKEIGWHEVDACGYGYYMAGRQAADDILKRGAYPGNVNYNA